MSGNFQITRGDVYPIVFRLRRSGSFHDLTGATVKTKFIGAAADGSEDIEFDTSAHTIDPSQTSNPGKVTLTLDATNSGNLPIGNVVKYVHEVAQTGNTLYFHGTLRIRTKRGS